MYNIVQYCRDEQALNDDSAIFGLMIIMLMIRLNLK